jgi:hypothetical protein
LSFAKDRENEVIIGFTGGKENFANSTLSELKNRLHYKWDYSTNMSGKNRSDWLSGSTVLGLINKSSKYPIKR